MVFINYIVKKRGYLIPLCAATLYLALLIFPELAARGIKSSIELCISTLIPSLFPYCVCTELLLLCNFEKSLSRLFKRPFNAFFHLNANLLFPYIIGIISGYPQGSIAIVKVYEKGGCTKKEAEHALCFCNNTGIAFIMGVCSSLFGNKKIALTLFVLQLFVSLFYAFIFRPTQQSSLPQISEKEENIGFDIFPRALVSSLSPMASVCGFVMMFGFITEIMIRFFSFFALNESVCALLLSFAEISKGIYGIALLSSPLKYPLAAFALCFSGICVHLQIYSRVKGVLSFKKFFFAKLFQGCIAFWAMLFLKIS